MPDLRHTRKNIKTALAVLGGAWIWWPWPCYSRRWWARPNRGARNSINCGANCKARPSQVKPLRNLDKKVITANRQITTFIRSASLPRIRKSLTQFGKLAVANGVTIEQVKYKA